MFFGFAQKAGVKFETRDEKRGHQRLKTLKEGDRLDVRRRADRCSFHDALREIECERLRLGYLRGEAGGVVGTRRRGLQVDLPQRECIHCSIV